MVCIYCGGKTQVTNSRAQKRVNHVWRRRECYNCHAAFTTQEAVDYSGSIVVRPERAAGQSIKHLPSSPFSRDKLYVSVLKALGHRMTAVDDATALTNTIIGRLLTGTTGAVITPATIIVITHETLARFDTAAAVQYRAYHQN